MTMAVITLVTLQSIIKINKIITANNGITKIPQSTRGLISSHDANAECFD